MDLILAKLLWGTSQSQKYDDYRSQAVDLQERETARGVRFVATPIGIVVIGKPTLPLPLPLLAAEYAADDPLITEALIQRTSFVAAWGPSVLCNYGASLRRLQHERGNIAAIQAPTRTVLLLVAAPLPAALVEPAPDNRSVFDIANDVFVDRHDRKTLDGFQIVEPGE